MAPGVHRMTFCIATLWMLSPVVVRAQADPNPETPTIDAFRSRSDIGASDQERIRRWIVWEVENVDNAQALFEHFMAQYNDPNNSDAFRTQFAAQTAEVAAQRFRDTGLNPQLSYGIARVMEQMDRIETLDGLLACLGSDDVRARYLCASSLARQRQSFAPDPARLKRVVDALKAAGLEETSGVVLGRIYGAIALPDQVDTVFDVYIDLFDYRLGIRRQRNVARNSPELYAFEFFVKGEVLGALNQTQKVELARRLAVFLRLDGQRYHRTDLEFNEIDRLERLLWINELILGDSRMLGADAGGKVRDALVQGGHANRAAVLQQVYRWVGNPETQQQGALNQAPWNVPVGAP